MVNGEIKRILVPLDGSKNSIGGLEEAIRIAKPVNASITGLCVIPTVPPITMPGIQTGFRDQMTDDAAKFMAEAKKIASRNGITFHGKLIYGIAVIDIADFANKKKYDLVVIGSHGRGSIKEMFLGSVSNAVVHKSKIPVLVVK
jgi:nucleotide-binding universal stress UspA family protein